MPSAYFGANTTKFNAGGSGDNIIADGQIKSVEKIWLDSYSFVAGNPTKTTIDIAILPAGRRLVGIDVMIATTTSQTNGTLSLGWSEDATFGTIMSPVTITHNATLSTISLPTGGILGNVVTIGGPDAFKIGAFQEEATGTKTTITLQINNWTMTNGTVKTRVRYV